MGNAPNEATCHSLWYLSTELASAASEEHTFPNSMTTLMAIMDVLNKVLGRKMGWVYNQECLRWEEGRYCCLSNEFDNVLQSHISMMWERSAWYITERPAGQNNPADSQPIQLHRHCRDWLRANGFKMLRDRLANDRPILTVWILCLQRLEQDFGDDGL